jgi:hypothetical protein
VGCDLNGGKLLEVRIKTDLHPNETSFVVKDTATGKNILKKKSFGTKPFKVIKKKKCVAVGTCFTFKIKDELSNGLSMGENGKEGYYKLFIEGTMIEKGKDFGGEATFSNCINESSTKLQEMYGKVR